MRAYGHIPDVFPEEDAHVGALVFNGGEVPEAVDLTCCLDAVQDQGATNSCVAQAMSTQALLFCRYRAQPVRRPSIKYGYDVARLMGGGDALADTGSSPRLAYAGARRYGMVPAEIWPLTAENVNEPPPWHVFQAASEMKLTGYYRIPTGFDAAHLARKALAIGAPVAFALHSTQAFEDWTPSQEPYAGSESTPLGSHMVVAVGFRPGALLVLNSWGTSWGERGFCWLDDHFFCSENVKDRIVVTACEA